MFLSFWLIHARQTVLVSFSIIWGRFTCCLVIRRRNKHAVCFTFTVVLSSRCILTWKKQRAFSSVSHARGRLLVCAPPYTYLKAIWTHTSTEHTILPFPPETLGFFYALRGEEGVVCEDSSSLCESLQMVFINILYSLKPKNMIWVHFLAFGPLICVFACVCVYSHADSYLHIYKYWAVQWGLPLPKTTLFQQHRMPGREQSHPPWQNVQCVLCLCSAGDDGEPHHLHLDFIHIEKQTFRLPKQLNSSFLSNGGYCKWAKHLVAT